MTSFRVSLLLNIILGQLSLPVPAWFQIRLERQTVSIKMTLITGLKMLKISKNSKIMTHWELSMGQKNFICRASPALLCPTSRPITLLATSCQIRIFLLQCRLAKRIILVTNCLLKLRKKKKLLMNLWFMITAKMLIRSQLCYEKICLYSAGCPWFFICLLMPLNL